MTTSRWILSFCAVVLLTGGWALAADTANSPVEELTKVLPDEVLLLAATSGGDALESGFDQSALGRMWNEPSMQSFVGAIKTQLLSKADELPDEELPQVIGTVLEYAQLVLARPVVVGIAKAEVEEGPPACLFAILDAGDRKADFVAALEKLEQVIGKDDIVDIQIGSLQMRGSPETDDLSVYWGWAGNYLVAAANDQQRAVVKYLSRPRSAAASYLNKVPGNGDALAIHYELGELLQMVSGFAAGEGAEAELTMVKTVLRELGLSNIGAMTARAGFSGRDLVSDSFVGLPAPRTGVAAAFKPVDLSMLRLVDARAMGASAFNCDGAAIYDTVMKAVQTASPNDLYPAVREGLAEVGSEIGFDIRNDLLGTLAGPVAGYTLPAGTMIEAPMGGFVAIAELTDGPRFERSLTTLSEFASRFAEGMVQFGDQTDEAGRTIHIISSPAFAFTQVMPTWCVVDGKVVVGSSLALCKMGIERTLAPTNGTTSLLETDAFKRVSSQLPQNVLSLTYTDSRTQLTQMMTQLQQIWPMAVMAANQAGFELPVMLPSLGQVAADMPPSLEYCYARPAGIYSHYQGSGIEVSLEGVAGAAVGAGVLMPALARTRQLATRVTSATNLSAIGKACLIYANDYDDKLPPNLEALVDTVELSPKCLESEFKPAGSDEASYIYVAGQTISMYPGNVIAYDNPAFCREGLNVLFLDSHVEFMKPDAFRQALEATYARLGRPMPEIEIGD